MLLRYILWSNSVATLVPIVMSSPFTLPWSIMWMICLIFRCMVEFALIKPCTWWYECLTGKMKQVLYSYVTFVFQHELSINVCTWVWRMVQIHISPMWTLASPFPKLTRWNVGPTFSALVKDIMPWDVANSSSSKIISNFLLYTTSTSIDVHHPLDLE